MAHLALQIFLAPGNAVCDLLHTDEGENRMMLRTLVNMLVWNLTTIIVAYLIFRG